LHFSGQPNTPSLQALVRDFGRGPAKVALLEGSDELAGYRRLLAAATELATACLALRVTLAAPAAEAGADLVPGGLWSRHPVRSGRLTCC
jgi:hypothetical protein